MLKVNAEMATVARKAFGGKTFKDKMEEIANSLSFVKKERRTVISGHMEAASQEEVAQAGGLMLRAMTEG